MRGQGAERRPPTAPGTVRQTGPLSAKAETFFNEMVDCLLTGLQTRRIKICARGAQHVRAATFQCAEVATGADGVLVFLLSSSGGAQCRFPYEGVTENTGWKAALGCASGWQIKVQRLNLDTKRRQDAGVGRPLAECRHDLSERN